MKRTLIALFLALASLGTTAARGQPINELPLFGGQKKNGAQREADRIFIEEASRAAGSRRKAADEIVRRGWEALGTGRTVDAIKRLNQGYLLDPKHPEVYWGLGWIACSRKGFVEARALYMSAIKFAPKSASVKADYAQCLMQEAVELRGSSASQSARKADLLLKEAETILRKAARDDPSSALVRARLANVLVYAGENEAALAEAREAARLGGAGLDPSMVKEIERRIAAKLPPTPTPSVS